jgi:orsellinic acid C2-O-methyltransferase
MHYPHPTTSAIDDATDRAPAEAAARLAELADGLRAAQALYVAAELQIADHLSERSLNSAELAAITGTDAGALDRIMRALCALGVFAESASGHFSLNSVGKLLRSDRHGSYRAAVRFMAGPVRWRCWSELIETVRTGLSASERVLGMQLFDFYAAHPAESQIHDDAMRSFSASHAAELIEAIDVRKANIVVDVGGGTGELLASILAAHVHLRGVLFDLPNVIDRHVLGTSGVSDRCSVERGSFFERIPGCGDMYLLKQVLHDWDDERAGDILRCCRRCIPQNARVVVIERKMSGPADSDGMTEAFLADLEMLVMTPGGRERTENEYRKLLADAGFKYLRTSPTTCHLWVFEAQPV